MKTVSTKLDNRDFEKFQEMCNDEGMCASEELRDMIKRTIEAYEEGLEMERNKKSESNAPKPIVTPIVENVPRVSMAHGKILDDNGNIIGTF